ncbi:type II toxin-antitoxin system RelE/ParE family toxin [Planctomicrobium piriforme]|uniref:ParE toxin of type II toxin-antitoxin system, parDE n=1 Tax=Planctomicrobium piriforme TaxID=1576369 RepID=A0A1I3TFZ3_9PLAN|nr:type II toxin-antitoxin system RelE/ParE family toxin [Planctomicrobium piriforme]SFJ70078.1 ParE toxin of type II toxin-antitoxin system, parDE [Planctomicrobium piriforme]
MTRLIHVSARANADADSIYEWIAASSADGANRWYETFLAALQLLRERADSYAAAPEAERLGVDLRQTLFKTRKGRTYRALFVIDHQTVYIVGVRGAGQNLVSEDDLDLP